MHNLSLYSRVCRAGEKTLNNHRKYYSTLLLRAPYGSCMVMVTPAELGSCKWLKTEQRTGEPLGGRKTNDERKREGGGGDRAQKVVWMEPCGIHLTRPHPPRPVLNPIFVFPTSPSAMGPGALCCLATAGRRIRENTSHREPHCPPPGPPTAGVNL